MTAGEDGAARIWDAATGGLLRPFRGSLRALTSASFGPGNTTVLTSSRDGSARLYTCDVCGSLNQLLEIARARATRSLTADERRAYLGGT